MKLNSAQLPTVEQQLGVEAIPEQHPINDNLKQALGDHTFFLDADGLSIVEPQNAPAEGSTGVVIKLARWASDERTELLTQEPEILPVTVDLKSD